MATLKLRGRAASAIRVGKVIKDVLNGVVQSEDGTLVHEAAIVDIHHVYKRLVREANMLRKTKLKPMVYSSFVCQFRFAEKLGLVELVRKEDMLFPPPTGNLYTFRVADGNIGEVSKRHIYKLTQNGIQDELSWSNLTQAYIQHWVSPQPAPVYETVKLAYKFSPVPSRDQMAGFRDFLISRKYETEDLRRIYSSSIGDWSLYFEDRMTVSPDAKRYQQLKEYADQLSELLYDYKIDESVDLLAQMIQTINLIHSREGSAKFAGEPKVESEEGEENEEEQVESEEESEEENEEENGEEE